LVVTLGGVIYSIISIILTPIVVQVLNYAGDTGYKSYTYNFIIGFLNFDYIDFPNLRLENVAN